jgi:propanol-preferring alcohol dehydrogenase
MDAMVLHAPATPLHSERVPVPHPGPGQVLLRVHACGVCRTDLHIVDGELREPSLPLIPGHQIVGSVVAAGEDVHSGAVGDRVGVPWLGWTCGTCDFCRRGRENLCERARFTGYHIDGGFAEYAVADHRFCFAIPDGYPDVQAAPLLCAGLIGYRSLRLAGEDAARIGVYGFGAAAHILTQVATAQGRQVFAFTRAGDAAGQTFALELGAVWAGDASAQPPEPLDAAIIFAPAGELVPAALRAVAPGGTVVCGGIHMSDIPSFPYEILWRERVLRSVANLTRVDGTEFLALAPTVPVHTRVESFPLDRANEALAALRAGRITGAAVLAIHASPSDGAATASSSDDAATASAATPSRRASQMNGSASA